MHFYKESLWQSDIVGNNAISHSERMALGSQGKLFVPQLAEGTIEDLTLGENIVFEEIEDGKLVSCRGLSSLLKISHNNKIIYITDNHNHALYFRYNALHAGLISKGLTLLHVDQHADMNKPDQWIDAEKESDMEYIAEYVNTHTQIASFIEPALQSGVVKECIQIRSETKLQEVVEKADQYFPYILDIDIDFFAQEDDISQKVTLLQDIMHNASIITIATSPYFIDQKRAIAIVKQLLK